METAAPMRPRDSRAFSKVGENRKRTRCPKRIDRCFRIPTARLNRTVATSSIGACRLSAQPVDLGTLGDMSVSHPPSSHADAPLDFITRLAAIAHDLWCAHMRAEGWHEGPFNPSARSHDALVPFERLGSADRRAARSAVQAEEVDRLLTRIIDYPRGSNRPLGIEEMRPRMRVVFCSAEAPRSRAAVKPGDIGEIEAWEKDESGELSLVVVRWASGELERYLPEMRELARWDELPERG
jgi:hypothetical protein